ncbi:MAG: hypothetical protein EBW68_00800 [Actinobacteria bacterium]|nr:hypothetical protein [Actinomycetota bacterium]
MERRETERQRQARIRREEKERIRIRIANLKALGNAQKDIKKQQIANAIQNFNARHGVICRYLSRVKAYFKRHGEDLDDDELILKLLNEYQTIPQAEDRGEVANYPVKDESGIFHRLRLKVFRVYKNVLFTSDYIPLMARIYFKLAENVPNGFRFGCAINATLNKIVSNDKVLKGIDIYEPIEGERPKTIKKSTFINNVDDFIMQIAESERLNEHSEKVYITNYFELFYFSEQGGDDRKINIEDLKNKYEIYNPKTADNCGQLVLRQFNIKAKRGKMTIADLKSYKPPINVYNDIKEINEDKHFILLRDNHFIICKERDHEKERLDRLKKRIAEQKTAQGKEKEQQRAEKLAEKRKDPQYVEEAKIRGQNTFLKRIIKGVKQQEKEHKIKIDDPREYEILQGLKEQEKKEKLNYMKSNEYKAKRELKALKKTNLYNPIVYDLESYNEKRGDKFYQIPVITGTAEKIGDEIIFKYYEDEDGLERFITMLKESNYTHLIGFNSGKYDYLLIKNELIAQGANIEEFTKGANGVMRVNIKFDNGKTIIFVDLCNFTSGKLSENLENYNCETAKGEIDYPKINKWGSMGEDFKNELIEYLKSDCIGTYQLYEKLEEPYSTRGLIFLDLFTSSQGAKKIVNHFWKLGEFKIQKTTSRKIDNFYREAIYGGRCEVYKRKFKSEQYDNIILGNINYDDVDDYLRALDKNSQYPEAMAFNLYPTGDEIYTHSFKSDKLGIYKCYVEKPKNIKYPLLPDKNNKQKATNYNLFDGEGVYTSIDIIQARKYGYKIKILYGYYWSESDYIFKDYINEFYEIKKNTPKGTPLYNLSKLMMNAIYGKMIQKDKNEKNFIFTTYEEYEEQRIKLPDTMGEWSGYCDTSEDIGKFIATFTYKEYEKKYTSKKSYIGAFILSYSKLEMYDMMTICDPYYTDTDSLYTHRKYSDNFRMGEELGEFSDDHEGKIIRAIFSAKKLKYLEVLKPDYIYKLDDEGKPLLDKKGKKIIDKDEQGNKLYNNNNKYTIKREYTGKGCDISKLTTKDFEDMAEGLEVENIRDFRMRRDLKNGEVEYIFNDTKILKMNDSNRYFINNESLPLGHIDIPATA